MSNLTKRSTQRFADEDGVEWIAEVERNPVGATTVDMRSVTAVFRRADGSSEWHRYTSMGFAPLNDDDPIAERWLRGWLAQAKKQPKLSEPGRDPLDTGPF